MAVMHYDTYGHQRPAAPSPTLPCIALSNNASTTVGIGPLAVSGTGGAGAGATTSYNGGTGTGASAVDTIGTKPNDSRGQFVLTAAGTPVGGLIAQVNFTQPYTQPVQVQASCLDTTASPVVAIPVAVQLASTGAGATTGFQIASSGTALTAAHAYLITYSVQP
jgi:hypothetical protein